MRKAPSIFCLLAKKLSAFALDTSPKYHLKKALKKLAN